MYINSCNNDCIQLLLSFDLTLLSIPFQGSFAKLYVDAGEVMLHTVLEIRIRKREPLPFISHLRYMNATTNRRSGNHLGLIYHTITQPFQEGIMSRTMTFTRRRWNPGRQA